MPKKTVKRKTGAIKLTPENREWDFPTEGSGIPSDKPPYTIAGYEFLDANLPSYYEGSKGKFRQEKLKKRLKRLASLRTNEYNEHLPYDDIPIYSGEYEAALELANLPDPKAPIRKNIQVEKEFPEIWEHEYEAAIPKDSNYLNWFIHSDWYNPNSRTPAYDNPKFKYANKPKESSKEDLLNFIDESNPNPFERVINNESADESNINEFDIINNNPPGNNEDIINNEDMSESPSNLLYNNIMRKQEDEIYDNQMKKLNYNLTDPDFAPALDFVPEERLRRTTDQIYNNVLRRMDDNDINFNNVREVNNLVQEESDNVNRNQFVYKDDVEAWRDRWESLKGMGQYLLDTINKYKRYGAYGIAGIAAIYALYKLIQYLRNRPKAAPAPVLPPAPVDNPKTNDVRSPLRRRQRTSKRRRNR